MSLIAKAQASAEEQALAATRVRAERHRAEIDKVQAQMEECVPDAEVTHLDTVHETIRNRDWQVLRFRVDDVVLRLRMDHSYSTSRHKPALERTCSACGAAYSHDLSLFGADPEKFVTALGAALCQPEQCERCAGNARPCPTCRRTR